MSQPESKKPSRASTRSIGMLSARNAASRVSKPSGTSSRSCAVSALGSGVKVGRVVDAWQASVSSTPSATALPVRPGARLPTLISTAPSGFPP